ncbi:MAG: inorganic phosphate transporter, partial [Myxococcota bacterium]
MAVLFECINGFHDAANAVAMVIYTKSMPPRLAVIWSGIWNFIGVNVGGVAVAFAIVHLLPVDLVVKVGSNAGLAMVFALLVSAILWNFGTWYKGLPASSTHTLIGAIIGVGMANALLQGHPAGSQIQWYSV